MVRVDRLYLGPIYSLINWVVNYRLRLWEHRVINYGIGKKLGRELLPDTAVFAWLSTLCAPLLLLNRWNNCWNSFAERKQTEHPTKRRKRIQITEKL
jgi:hypothetical protein